MSGVRVSLRSVVLPRDHGSWSLALEPVVLGLVSAPSLPGAALGMAALALFLSRRPWQVARAADGRRLTALSVVAALGAMAVVALALGLVRSRGPAALAVLAAVPFAGAFAWFDRQKAGREVAAELSGACAFATLAAAIALAAGRDEAVAIGLAGFVLARAVTSIVPIRTYLRRRKGQVVPVWPSAAVCVAATLVSMGVWWETGRSLPVIWAAVFSLRTAWLLGPLAPAWPATRIGAIEATIGAAAALTFGASMR